MVSIPDLGGPQNILIKLPINQNKALNFPNLIDLGDDLPSDDEEVSKPEVPDLYSEPDFAREVTVERELYR